MENKVVLFDADSLVYQSIYKVISLTEIKEMYSKGETRYTIELEILQRGYDRFEKIVFDIINEIEERYNVVQISYFFTKCKRNFRKEIDPTYKANRKGNKWVGALRDYLIHNLDNAFASDEYEADDLIYLNTELMEVDDYIICGIDKDLRQIAGLHYDYYQVKVKSELGTYLLDEFGKEIKKRKGFIYVTPEEALDNKFKMLLIGDVSDNVKGVKGIGEVKASKLLKDKTTFGKFISTCREYAKEGGDWKDKLRKNNALLLFNH